jgi:TadE-like protein
VRGERAHGGDRGSASMEFAAILPTAMFLILFSFEAIMAAATIERVENAARTGARSAGQRGDPQGCPAAATEALPGWLNEHTVYGQAHGDGVRCRVRAKVPLLFPGIPLDFTIDRAVTMPLG